MPGRTNTRRSAGARQSVAAHTPRSTKKDARTRSPSIDIPNEGPDSTLRKHLTAVFTDAQRSNIAHRKLVVNLRKIQESCCFEDSTCKIGKDGEDYDEDDFNNELTRCVLRLLALKKGESVGDRVIRFLGIFLTRASDKDNALVTHNPDALDPQDMPTVRLLHVLLKAMLQFISAKDKIVRFRAVQITAHLVNKSTSMDADLSDLIRMALLKRIHDKEASIRMHAVYGLGPFAEADADADDSDDSDNGASGVLEKLLLLLQNDPSAEVRRSVLLNLDVTSQTLPYQLERARDLDAATRRALFARLLPDLGDFRHLSLTHREKLLRWGLRDRDETVRKATARLFREKWIQDCAARPANKIASEDDDVPDEDNEPAAPKMSALLELLERIDVLNSASNGVAHEAMKEFWDGRPDYRDCVQFDDNFWLTLTPESIFIARTLNDYCRTAATDADGRLLGMLEDKLPEVTKFGFLLQRVVKSLVETVREAATGGPDGDGDDEMERESVAKEFIVEQMLAMALTLDYSDEVGRRKMLGLIRDALTMPELPEETTRLMIEILRLVSTDDRDFCGLVLEAIAEVHDTIMDSEPDQDKEDSGDEAEDSFHSARSAVSADQRTKGKTSGADADGDTSMEDGLDEERAIKEIMVNMKCLHIAQCMLQNVQCDLEANVHLVTMLNNLVVPAVRSQEAPIRERGLVCLGLCCLLAKNLAEENLTLFLHCFAKGHAELQVIALQIMTDILTTHPSLLRPPKTATSGDADMSTTRVDPAPLSGPVMKTYAKALKSEEPSVQATGATAISKLMLGQLITDLDLLKQLVVTFLDPDTSDNAQLRQALSYFIPVYCHSRSENAARMVSVATGVIAKMATMRESFLEDDDEDQDREMVTLATVGGLLADWTDPRKIVPGLGQGKSDDTCAEEAKRLDRSLHLMLAEQILERLVTSQTSKDERKVLFTVLGKLQVNVADPDPSLLRTVLELLAECAETKAATDATSRNVLKKLQSTLLKLIHDSAGADRGGSEETGLDETMGGATPRNRRQTRTPPSDDGDEDENEATDDPTRQLEQEMQSTRLEDATADNIQGGTPRRTGSNAEQTGDSTEGEEQEEEEQEQEEEEYDISQLPDEHEMQSLVSSLEDEDEDDEI